MLRRFLTARGSVHASRSRRSSVATEPTTALSEICAKQRFDAWAPLGCYRFRVFYECSTGAADGLYAISRRRPTTKRFSDESSRMSRVKDLQSALTEAQARIKVS